MKYFLTALLLSYSIALFSQIEKGTLMLGGSAGFSTSSSEFALDGGNREYTSRSISFSPNVGMFVADRFAIGLTLPIHASQTKGSSSGYEGSNTNLGIGPSFRYYFPLADDWALFPELAYVYQSSKTKITALDQNTGMLYEETYKAKSSNINLGVGLSYFLNKSIGLEGILDYNIYTSEGTNTSGTLAFAVGFQIYFARD